MKNIKMKISWANIIDQAKDMILDASVQNIPGEEKMQLVLDQLITFLDNAITPERMWQEALSDMGLKGLRVLLQLFVQDCFDKLREQAQV